MTRATAQRIGRISGPIITIVLLLASPIFLMGSGKCVIDEFGEDICTTDYAQLGAILGLVVGLPAIATAIAWTKSRRVRLAGSPIVAIVAVGLVGVAVSVPVMVVKPLAVVAAFGMFANVGPRVDPQPSSPTQPHPRNRVRH